MSAGDQSKLSRTLVDVAMGRAKADLVLRSGKWVCVQSGEVVDATDVAIKGERIAYVGPDASHTIGRKTKVIEASGRFLLPGLLDGHVHIESGMLTVTEFVRAVLPHGTTGLFVDPHEMANVLGLAGVRMMVDEAARQPIHVWVNMPSCVPSVPGLETTGATIGPRDVAKAMKWPGVIGLGEVMDFPGVSRGDAKMHAEMAETRAAGKVIGGHYASPDLGLPFHGYAAGGPEDDHEGTRLEDAVARVRQGMKAMLRFGSGWRDVEAQIPAVTKLGMDSRHFMLVTDDCHAGTLVGEGHMDRVLRHAIQKGLPPMTAIQMATLNTAEHFGVARDVGQIAPGRYADILLVSDLTALDIQTVIAKGCVAVESGQLRLERPSFNYPKQARASIHLAQPLREEDFTVRSPREGKVALNVIGVVENQAPTRRLRLTTQAAGGEVKADMAQDLAKVAVIERHRGTGRVSVGFVQGFGFQVPCALASTVAHDAHNIIVVGTEERSMAVAANELARLGGGQCVVQEGKVTALLELPIAGLVSDDRAEVVAQRAAGVLDAMRACGAAMANANMQLSLLALVVIPELRISDRGLVDVSRQEFISVVEKAD